MFIMGIFSQFVILGFSLILSFSNLSQKVFDCSILGICFYAHKSICTETPLVWTLVMKNQSLAFVNSTLKLSRWHWMKLLGKSVMFLFSWYEYYEYEYYDNINICFPEENVNHISIWAVLWLHYNVTTSYQIWLHHNMTTSY